MISSQSDKTEQKKVTNTVDTFLAKDRDGVQVATTKTELEKVANTVATFLSDDRNLATKRWFSCTSHENRTGKGYRYGGNLFERGKRILKTGFVI